MLLTNNEEVTFTTTTVGELAPKRYEQLKRLSFGERGVMYDRLSFGRSKYSTTSQHVIFATTDDNRVVGWTMVFPYLWDHKFQRLGKEVSRSLTRIESHYYVRCTHRRLGLGSELVKRANDLALTNFGKKCRVIADNPENTKFFESAGITRRYIK